MRVFRFQGTKDIETNSYFEDLMDIWYTVESYKETFDTDVLPEVFISELIDEHKNTLSLRDEDIDFVVSKIIDCKSEEEAWEIAQKYKLCGVFAINAEGLLIEEVMNLSVYPQMGLSNKYLIEANAELIEDLGKEYGLLVNITDIANIYETPTSLVKKKEKNSMI